jgi:hypothetical protein
MKKFHGLIFLVSGLMVFFGYAASLNAATPEATDAEKKSFMDKLKNFMNKPAPSPTAPVASVAPAVTGNAVVGAKKPTGQIINPAGGTALMKKTIVNRPPMMTPGGKGMVPTRNRPRTPARFSPVPPGPAETALREFDEKTRAERATLMNELKTYPPDEKEGMLKEFQAKIMKEQKEFFEKLKSIPAGKKEQKRTEFEKRASDERKALIDKLRSTPPAPAAMLKTSEKAAANKS